jgi:hypothetical protein
MFPIVAAIWFSSFALLSDPVDLVVHEWGTFTTMQGSDGITLEGLQHEEEPLPDFVHAIDGYSAIDVLAGLSKGVGRPVRGCTVKMETPVTYFYSPHSLLVHARVEFDHGMLTQWYPAVAEYGVRGAPKDEQIDFARVERGWLDWQVEVLAPKFGVDATPSVDAGAPWLSARTPEANCVRAHVAATEDRPALDETEEFLFYRGLGRFDLPIHVSTSPGSLLDIANTSTVASDVLTHLFVLNVRDGRGEFSYVPRVAPGKSVRVERPLGADAPAIDGMIAALQPKLEAALVDSGLFAPEAHAMVETWKRSYFKSPGLRVLYVVPQRITDAVLPLAISPKPRAQVRVLVGRLECIAPEQERDTLQALSRFVDGDDDTRSAAWDHLSKLERFLEPNLRRAIALTNDARVAEQAAGWVE